MANHSLANSRVAARTAPPRQRSSAYVLVVDDDPGIRELLSLVLLDEGYEVLTAANGAAALEWVAQRPPHLILLDLNMPVMDGWEFAAAYRQTPPPLAPIIVLTAGSNAAVSASHIDAAGFVAKPFDVADVLTVVSRYTVGS
ncbi:MAG: response regulator [Chloroflexi bacterium]|nr:response regulator [Chloroflexota bacterium]